MPITTIDTTEEAHCLNDITENWKIAGYQSGGIWSLNGDLSGHDLKMFRELAFPPKAGDQPKISCVTGPRPRQSGYQLYARMFPLNLRRA